MTATLAGRERRLRLTFEGLAEIEGRLETGIVAVAGRFSGRSVGTREVAAILGAGLDGGGEAMEEIVLKAAIMELGFVEATRLAGRLLAIGLGAEAEGEAPGKP
jgi:hypothetical protein